MRTRVLVIGVAAVLVASQAVAQAVTGVERRENFRAGQAAGAYVGAADLVQAFRESQCGYALKGMSYPTVAQRVSEASDVLTRAQVEELRRYLASTAWAELQAEFRAVVPMAIEAARKDGVDHRTLCGTLITPLLIQIEAAEQQWRRYVSERR
jgi:hypothetical protein